jgi:hypothetical protein
MPAKPCLSEPLARSLVYSATAYFRHDSIPTARDALIARGRSIDLQFDATEDPTRFTDAGLAPYDLLVFLMNTGKVRQRRLLLQVWGLLAVITPPRG